MVNFFLRLIIEICQFFSANGQFFWQKYFSIPTLESYISAVNEAITEKKIDTIELSDEETTMTINGNCKHFQWSLH